MKQIVTVSAILSVLAIAIFGCLIIFDVISFDAGLTNLFKIVGALVLLGACAALITFFVRSGKEPPA